jgi:predicted lipoprotein with Yx(FWY)xxD motif
VTGSRQAISTLRRRHPTLLLVSVSLAALALAASFAAMALATSSITIGSASNSKLGKRVAVNPQGHTLYMLSGESRTRQFCKSTACLSLWPPVRASSRHTLLKDGAGLHGSLGIISRPHGLLQVTLRGVPLYRFSGDKAKGEANGEGIREPGNHVWHAAAASSGSSSAPTPAMPNPSPPPSPSPGYTPPAY